MDENNEQNIEKTEYDDTTSYDGGIDKKKIIFIVIVIVIAVGLAIGSILLVRNIMNKGNNKVPQATTTEAIFDKSLEDTYKLDKDFDGISDEDEKKYGTSVTSSDTDEDGLTDDAEINRFKTNPIKADTDGDGYNDGYEVRRGFNPNGAGSL